MGKHQPTQAIWPPDTGIRDYERAWNQFASPEMAGIKSIWAEQQQRLAGTQQLSRFTDQLSRQWSIETGVIENVYQLDRGITQTLIEHGFRTELLTHGSTDKSPSYVIRVLEDQRAALDGVFDFIKQQRSLSTSYIKELHAALVRSQDATEAIDAHGNVVEIKLQKGCWKTQPNYPMRDGVVYTYCPPEQVASEMDRLVAMHDEHTQAGVAAEVEAAWLHHRFSQIHPFQDGNGRVCRALASMVLIRAGLFPVVVTRDDKARYLDALEAADDGDLSPLVELIAALQRALFRKATALSQDVLSTTTSVSDALEDLKNAAQRRRSGSDTNRASVVALSRLVEEDLQQYLESLLPDLQKVMLQLSPTGTASVERSNETTAHYHWRQIVEVARQLEYYADDSNYRAWISLDLQWTRQARLVFAVHGVGRSSSGALICSPFLQLRDVGEDGTATDSEMILVTDEGFLFFHDNSWAQVGPRFQSWRDKVVAVALNELGSRF